MNQKRSRMDPSQASQNESTKQARMAPPIVEPKVPVPLSPDTVIPLPSYAMLQLCDAQTSDNPESSAPMQHLIHLSCAAHTDAFTSLATEEDFESIRATTNTAEDDSGVDKFISRLQCMNIPIANHGTFLDYTLWQKFEELQRQGRTFLLDWHQGGKTNVFACTKMICACCHAKLLIKHPGLPSKGGAIANPELIEKLNEELVFFFVYRRRNTGNASIISRRLHS